MTEPTDPIRPRVYAKGPDHYPNRNPDITKEGWRKVMRIKWTPWQRLILEALRANGNEPLSKREVKAIVGSSHTSGDFLACYSDMGLMNGKFNKAGIGYYHVLPVDDSGKWQLFSHCISVRGVRGPGKKIKRRRGI